MRIILKILLFPVTLVLSIIVAICRLLCIISGTVLGIVSFAILLVAIGTVVLLGEPLMTGLGELVGGLNDTLKAI